MERLERVSKAVDRLVGGTTLNAVGSAASIVGLVVAIVLGPAWLRIAASVGLLVVSLIVGIFSSRLALRGIAVATACVCSGALAAMMLDGGSQANDLASESVTGDRIVDENSPATEVAQPDAELEGDADVESNGAQESFGTADTDATEGELGRTTSTNPSETQLRQLGLFEEIQDRSWMAWTGPSWESTSTAGQRFPDALVLQCRDECAGFVLDLQQDFSTLTGLVGYEDSSPTGGEITVLFTDETGATLQASTFGLGEAERIEIDVASVRRLRVRPRVEECPGNETCRVVLADIHLRR